jgi:hypothetical protein
MVEPHGGVMELTAYLNPEELEWTKRPDLVNVDFFSKLLYKIG